MVIVIVTAICLLTFGIWYARLERDRPIRPTYLAVVIGVAVTVAGQIITTLAFYHLSYGTPGIIAGIAAPFVLTGVPMAFFQESKERQFVDEANSDATGTPPGESLNANR